MFSENSIKVLENAGINFDQHLEYGIEPTDFGELLMSSGLVLLEQVKWVSFRCQLRVLLLSFLFSPFPLQCVPFCLFDENDFL
jgi:hypothetical protein